MESTFESTARMSLLDVLLPFCAQASFALFGRVDQIFKILLKLCKTLVEVKKQFVLRLPYCLEQRLFLLLSLILQIASFFFNLGRLCIDMIDQYLVLGCTKQARKTEKESTTSVTQPTFSLHVDTRHASRERHH